MNKKTECHECLKIGFAWSRRFRTSRRHDEPRLASPQCLWEFHTHILTLHPSSWHMWPSGCRYYGKQKFVFFFLHCTSIDAYYCGIKSAWYPMPVCKKILLMIMMKCYEASFHFNGSLQFCYISELLTKTILKRLRNNLCVMRHSYLARDVGQWI